MRSSMPVKKNFLDSANFGFGVEEDVYFILRTAVQYSAEDEDKAMRDSEEDELVILPLMLESGQARSHDIVLVYS